MGKQIRIKESELRELVAENVRSLIREIFERDIDDDSYYGGGLPDDYRYDGDEEPEEYDDEPEQ